MKTSKKPYHKLPVFTPILCCIWAILLATMSGCGKQVGPKVKDFEEYLRKQHLEKRAAGADIFEIGGTKIQSEAMGEINARFTFETTVSLKEPLYDSVGMNTIDPELTDRFNRVNAQIAATLQPLERHEKLMSETFKDTLSKTLPDNPFQGYGLVRIATKKGTEIKMLGSGTSSLYGDTWVLQDVIINKIIGSHTGTPATSYSGKIIETDSSQAKSMLKDYVEKLEITHPKLQILINEEKQRIEQVSQAEKERIRQLKLAYLQKLTPGARYKGMVEDLQNFQTREVTLTLHKIAQDGDQIRFTIEDMKKPSLIREFNAKVVELTNGSYAIHARSDSFSRNAGLFFGYSRGLECVFDITEQTFSCKNNPFKITLTRLSDAELSQMARAMQASRQRVFDTITAGKSYTGLLKRTDGKDIYSMQGNAIQVQLQFRKVEHDGAMIEAVLIFANDTRIIRSLKGHLNWDATKTDNRIIVLKSYDKGTVPASSVFGNFELVLTLNAINDSGTVRGVLSNHRDREIEVTLKLTQ